MNFFTPYEGKEPYIFVSYAHANSPEVMEVINDMHSRGYRIWYDEGIEVGSEWPECIAEHLKDAHLMLAFISGAYMNSDNCRREMHYALMKRIKVINIFLENTAMTPGMEMQIGNIFALMKYTLTRQTFFDRLYSAPLLNSEGFIDAPEGKPAAASAEAEPAAELEAEGKERRETAYKTPKKAAAEKPRRDKKPAAAKKQSRAGRIIGWTAALLLFAAVVTLGIIGHFTGLNERIIIRLKTEQTQLLPSGTKAEFSTPMLERIARAYSGVAEGDLYVSDIAGITELYIAGNDWYFSAGERDSAGDSGAGGDLRDLSDLKYFTGLKTLSINGQNLSTLSTMPALGIQYLDISRCRVSSLDGIGALTKLRELRAQGCPVTDLGDISRCLELRLIDLNGSSLSDFSAFKPLTRLTSFYVSGCTTDEMKAVLHLSSLTDVGFYNCDLRGSFFKSFDRESAIVSLTLDGCTLDSTANLDDFGSLTTLTLVSTGENLDWTLLNELPVLNRVYIDDVMEPAVSRVLGRNELISVVRVDATPAA